MKCKIYTVWGDELVATSIRPVKNKVGTGYRVEAELNGHKACMFYRTEEITTITQIKE